MSFTYSGNPAKSQLDECRFLISDTNESQPIMQDEEISYIIDTYGSNKAALRYHLFRQAATYFARDIKRSLGPQSEDPTARLDFYKAQMNLYKTQMSSGGIPVPVYAYPKAFRKGIHNNPPWPGGTRYVR